MFQRKKQMYISFFFFFFFFFVKENKKDFKSLSSTKKEKADKIIDNHFHKVWYQRFHKNSQWDMIMKNEVKIFLLQNGMRKCLCKKKDSCIRKKRVKNELKY